ncbi:tetratricopeptide repeat protein [Patescibacteria group bacterium]|nr:tetratricopeptide repeat protein [Patescibacteria group bacterium]
MYYLFVILLCFVGLGLIFYKKIKVIKKDIKLQSELVEEDIVMSKGAEKPNEDRELKIEEVENEKVATQAACDDEADVAQKKRVPELVETARKAETLFSRGELDEAEKEYIKVLSLQEDHCDAMNRLGIIYLQQENYPKAELMLKKLIDLNSRNPIFFSNLGIALYKQKKLNEAVVAYEKAIKIDDSRAARFISLGQVYFELDNLEKSLEYFEEAFKRDNKNVDICFQIVDIAKMLDSVGVQKKYLDKTLQIDPYNEEAKTMLADLKE